METKDLRGGELAQALRETIEIERDRYVAAGILPKLVAVTAGNDPAVLGYLEVKRRAAEKLDILFEVLSAGDSEVDLIGLITKLSSDPAVHGIILELPLPVGFDADRALEAIHPAKDVDGLTAWNMGKALLKREDEAILGATAQACVLLAESFGPLEGKNIGLVGKGRTVGRPLIPMLLNRRATLTVCHSRTQDLKSALQDSAIVISAVGKAGILNASNLREGQIVIDAGTIYSDGKLVGDVAPDVKGIVAALTPVPQGVGPLTTAYLFKNLMRAIRLQYPQ